MADEAKTYPLVEELVVRASIKSEEHGIELLKCLQATVNTFGADTIIEAVRAIEKKPELLNKAMKALPYLKML